MSLSARRAWIEILLSIRNTHNSDVALRKESVDRNSRNNGKIKKSNQVALRKESVDRNLWWGVRKAVGSLVALRKESVDRNQGVHYDNYNLHWSLSARRAWIEIFITVTRMPIGCVVALRKESVDRNFYIAQHT